MPACSRVLKVTTSRATTKTVLAQSRKGLFGFPLRLCGFAREDSNCDNDLLIPVERSSPMDEFDRYRAAMNEKLLGSNHLGIKRFFALDTQAYEDGALDKRTKELMGLVASAVLRCDDCITYH